MSVAAHEDVQRQWIKSLRTDEVNSFGFAALAYLIGLTDLKPGDRVLDAGCGTGQNCVWLHSKGFSVTGADFSRFALANAAGTGIDYREEDLTTLSFENASFRGIICIGVLMHIPEVDKALRELVRVLKPGGWLIIAEANANAPETFAFRAYWKLRGRSIRVRRVLEGLEVWSTTSAGPLLCRKASASWLRRSLVDQGLKLICRTTGELTEVYGYSARFRTLWHRINRVWFRLKGPPSLAVGNYYVFKK